ncbi:MAG: hypothetical protein IPN10_03675 [Saprospiraceae bacterium]|nr:hypothetical protein [Saprospiraceae bacterium]
MNILSIEYKFNSFVEFESLTNQIQNQIVLGNLQRYSDQSWSGQRRDDWMGEYISLIEKKIYNLKGSAWMSTQGEENYQGNWEIVRSELTTKEGSEIISKYKIKKGGPGVFVEIALRIQFKESLKTIINIDWSKENLFYEKPHSNHIKSSIEYGIISAFEDYFEKVGIFKITIDRILYHNIDTSFSILCFAASRCIKRAFFVEHLDEYPKIENGFEIKKFKPNFTIGRLNNK